MVESFSEDEGIEDEPLVENAPSEIRELLTRKVELEKRQRNQELHRQRVKVLYIFFHAVYWNRKSSPVSHAHKPAKHSRCTEFNGKLAICNLFSASSLDSWQHSYLCFGTDCCHVAKTEHSTFSV